jgi:hypothetical protein
VPRRRDFPALSQGAAMRQHTSHCRLIGHLDKCRIAAVCAVLTALGFIAAVGLGAFDAPAAAPEATTAAAYASAPTAISYDKPTLASAGFPVECSQAPTGLDCLYY